MTGTGGNGIGEYRNGLKVCHMHQRPHTAYGQDPIHAHMHLGVWYLVFADQHHHHGSYGNDQEQVIGDQFILPYILCSIGRGIIVSMIICVIVGIVAGILLA